jgi:hypothetical protein
VPGVALQAVLLQFVIVDEVAEALFRETDGNELVGLDDRAFYKGRVVNHRGKCLVVRHVVAVDFRNLAPGQAWFGVETGLADALRPALQHLNIEAVFAQVMEMKLDIVFVRNS